MKLKIVWLGLCSLLVLFSTDCKEQQAVSADDFESSLGSIFENLGLTKLGVDYPTQSALESCKQVRPNCEEDYSRNYVAVQKAKKELLAKIAADPKRTLAFTLDTINHECSQDTNEIGKENEVVAFEIELRCVGAITALFFFNQDDQDKLIMARLIKSVPQVWIWLTRARFEWIYNRPNPERWIEAIKMVPDNQLEPDLKETIIQDFRDARQNSERFGVML